MVKATKLSSPPEWAEPRVAVVAFVSSDFCDACSALATRLNVLHPLRVIADSLERT